MTKNSFKLKEKNNISKIRIWARTSITTYWRQLGIKKFRILLVPFIFNFYLVILYQFGRQFFPYLAKDNLPGFWLIDQKISWEPFQKSTYKRVNLTARATSRAKKRLTKEKVYLINLFSKGTLQNKLFDFDELPLKLDQNDSIDTENSSNLLSEIIEEPEGTLFFKNNDIDDINCLQAKLVYNYSIDDNYNRIQFYKKTNILENELKKCFYEYGFSPFKNYTNPFTNLETERNELYSNNIIADLDLSMNRENESTTNADSIEKSEEELLFIIRSTNRLEVNLKITKKDWKNNILETLPTRPDLIQSPLEVDRMVPKQNFVIPSRLLSGYKRPNMERAKTRPLLIHNLYKNIVFQKQNQKSSLQIEDLSAFLYDFLNSSNYLNFGKRNFRKTLKVFLKLLPNPQFNFRYLPARPILLNKLLIEKSNHSGIYQRVFTLYNTDKNVKPSLPFLSIGRKREVPTNPFLPMERKGDLSSNYLKKKIQKIRIIYRESWEPLTLQSCLAVTKLSFAYFFFQNTKILITIYIKEASFLLKTLVSLGIISEDTKDFLESSDEKKEKGFRIIKKVKKSMKDVVGIDNILPELGEMLGVLRNSNPVFPKNFLFVGPPGTGKTLLVKAIAGQAEVPVLVQSGSSLSGVQSEGSNVKKKGAQRLRRLFEEARQIAPCILFIDEIDTIGQSRQNVIHNSVESNDLIQFLHRSNQRLTENSEDQFKNPGKLESIAERKNRGDRSINSNTQDTEKKQEELHLLTQLLIELDGVVGGSRNEIMVIGATNRPQVLDPALTRPGRFDRILHLELPGKEKRIEILKHYTENIGLTNNEISGSNFKSQYKQPNNSEVVKTSTNLLPEITTIRNLVETLLTKTTFLSEALRASDTLTPLPQRGQRATSLPSDRQPTSFLLNEGANPEHDFPWEYLANRTFGFSAADLAATMNQSALQAILRKTGHTIETIEKGIEYITSYTIERPKIKMKESAGSQYRIPSRSASDTLTPLPQRGQRATAFPSDREHTTPQGYVSRGMYEGVRVSEGGLFQRKGEPFFLTRIAYYQAGKAVLHTLLPQHPDALFLTLWPKPKNSRHKEAHLQFTSINDRAKLETRLIGLYAGKAAELIALSLNSHIQPFLPTLNSNLLHSTIGIEEISAANKLAHSLVDKWHFYSNTRKDNQILTNQNQLLVSEIDLFQQLTEEIQNIVSASNISESFLDRENLTHNFQERLIRPWWQNQITKEIGTVNLFYERWFRIYLNEPGQKEGLKGWAPADIYYHNTQNLKNLHKVETCFASRKRVKKFAKVGLKEKGKQIDKNEVFVRSFCQKRFVLREGSLRSSPIISKMNHINVEPGERYQARSAALLQRKGVSTLRYEGATLPQEEGGANQVTLSGPPTNSLHFDITWNDLYKLDRDYIYHALIYTCFNTAFSLLDENRELLDYLADYLMRFETLRQQKIKEIFYDFGYFSEIDSPKKTVSKNIFLKKRNQLEARAKISKDKQNIKLVFDKKWGKNSRRKFSRFFCFAQKPTLSKKSYFRPFTLFERIEN